MLCTTGINVKLMHFAASKPATMKYFSSFKKHNTVYLLLEIKANFWCQVCDCTTLSNIVQLYKLHSAKTDISLYDDFSLWKQPRVCSFLVCRRYLNKSQEDQNEDLPGLEEDVALELDLNVLRRRTMAAAAERRMQNQQDPAPWDLPWQGENSTSLSQEASPELY